MAQSYNREALDERYGYPVKLVNHKDEVIKAYYLGARPAVEGSNPAHYFVSIDAHQMAILNAYDGGRPGREFVISLPTLEDCTFLAPPPEAEKVIAVSFEDGVAFIRGNPTPITELLTRAAGDFAPYKIGIAWHLGSRMPLDIHCFFMRPTEYGKILIINELKALGLWGLSFCRFEYTARTPFSLD